MNVFNLRDQLVTDYSEYVRSYIAIRDERISKHVAQRLDEGMLWPEPLIQLNPSFEPGAWIDALVQEGVLHAECANIFRKDKTATSLGDKMRLHRHQEEAARVAKLGVNYVLTTGKPENILCGWNGGFDLLLGNPPWEKLQSEELQFFASRNPTIAALAGAKRKSAIQALPITDPPLAKEWEEQRRFDAATIGFIRNSDAYPLTGVGKFNTFALFAELNYRLMSRAGRVGCIVPSGIATDDTTKLFFSNLVESNTLVSLYDFENRNGIFPGVHRSYKFCPLTLGKAVGPSAGEADFVFFALQVEDIRDRDRRFTLSSKDISLLNPNTRTCPIFRSRRDAVLAKTTYKMVPVFLYEANPTPGEYQPKVWRLINTADDSGEFINPADAGAEPLVGVVEAKTIHQYDHRYASFMLSEGALEAQELSAAEKADPKRTVIPRYFIRDRYFRERMPKGLKDKQWFLTARNIARATDERTLIASLFPRGAGCEVTPYIEVEGGATVSACLLGIFNSFALDYFTRQKVGGTHLSYFILYQLPVLPFSTLAQLCPWSGQRAPASDWLLPRVLELTYTAWDLEPFARDCGYDGPPFRWDEERRFLLRCELDAAFFHLYGISQDDAAYILDTFPIVKRKDEAKWGTYRTKDTILEIYSALAAATQSDQPYATRLNPVPASIQVAHAPRFDRERVGLEVGDYIPGFVFSMLRYSAGTCDLMRLARGYALLQQPKVLAALVEPQFDAAGRKWVEQSSQPHDGRWFLPILRRMETHDIVSFEVRGDDVIVHQKDPQGPRVDAAVATDSFLVMRVLDAVPDQAVAEPVKRIVPKAPRVALQEATIPA